MYFSCWKSSKVYPGIRTLNFNVWHASCQGPCSEAWRWSWLGAFVRSLAGNPLTRARGGEQRKRVLSLLMWPMMWFISHCSHVNYIPKIQTLFLKEIEQKPALNPWQRFPYLLFFFLPLFFVVVNLSFFLSLNSSETSSLQILVNDFIGNILLFGLM